MSMLENEAYYRNCILELEKEKLKTLKNMSRRLDCIEEALWSIKTCVDRLCKVVQSK